VSFVASGQGASASNSVHQSEPVGCKPGAHWTVYRIQMPSPPSGAQVRR
jgi:hypothetical protein